MPQYTYICHSCDHEFIELRQMCDAGRPARCPKCSGRNTERVYDAPAVHYNGAGFYCKDKGGIDGGLPDEG